MILPFFGLSCLHKHLYYGICFVWIFSYNQILYVFIIISQNFVTEILIYYQHSCVYLVDNKGKVRPLKHIKYFSVQGTILRFTNNKFSFWL